MANSDPGQSWWNAYVIMNAQQAAYLSQPYSPGYDADFASSLAWCINNRAYGFADFNRLGAGGVGYCGGPQGFGNGPTKS